MAKCDICKHPAYVSTSHGEFCRPCALNMISQSLREQHQGEADAKAEDGLAKVIDMSKYRKSFKERYESELL